MPLADIIYIYGYNNPFRCHWPGTELYLKPLFSLSLSFYRLNELFFTSSIYYKLTQSFLLLCPFPSSEILKCVQLRPLRNDSFGGEVYITLPPCELIFDYFCR